MHRVQAALYDLLFGHAGLGPVPADLVDATFEEKSRPKSIVGISVVSQSASRNGRPEGATLAVAMRVDVATGRISGRIGRLKNGAMDRGAFQTLSRTLLEVASAGLTSIGDKQPDRRRNFVSFVRGVVDEVVRDDPNALILMESTTARSLWSWLSDESISSEVYLEDATARPPTSWKSLRFVRVRERSAGRLASEARRLWIPATKGGDEREGEVVEEVYATAIARLAESLPEGNARTRHYLTAHGFDVRNQGARGQSVYRQLAGNLFGDRCDLHCVASHPLAFLENFLPLIRKARQMRAFLIANGLQRPMIALFGLKFPKSLQPNLGKLPFPGDAPCRPKNESTAC
jgi:RNaseH domain of pPIWI_RE